MEVILLPEAEADLLPEAEADLNYWVEAGNKKVLKKITELTASILESPFQGIGKPEPLKHSHSGKWSRRINKEHRMIYEVQEEVIFVSSLRGHYQ